MHEASTQKEASRATYHRGDFTDVYMRKIMDKCYELCETNGAGGTVRALLHTRVLDNK